MDKQKYRNKLASLLGDQQFRSDVGQGITDAGNRGFVAGLLGMPVDAMAGVQNAVGMGGSYLLNKAGLLSAGVMYQPVERPVGGSEWIGQKMQNAGIVSDKRNRLAELLSGIAYPMAAVKAGPAIFNAEQAAIRNAAYPAILNRQIGGVLNPNTGTAKIVPWSEWQKTRGNNYQEWLESQSSVITNEAKKLQQMLADKGIKAESASLAGGQPYTYKNAIDGLSSYMHVPGYGEVRISDHMRASGLGNDRTFGSAESAFNSIIGKLGQLSARKQEYQNVREMLGLVNEGGKKNMMIISDWLAKNPQQGQAKDPGYWARLANLDTTKPGGWSFN